MFGFAELLVLLMVLGGAAWSYFDSQKLGLVPFMSAVVAVLSFILFPFGLIFYLGYRSGVLTNRRNESRA